MQGGFFGSAQVEELVGGVWSNRRQDICQRRRHNRWAHHRGEIHGGAPGPGAMVEHHRQHQRESPATAVRWLPKPALPGADRVAQHAESHVGVRAALVLEDDRHLCRRDGDSLEVSRLQRKPRDSKHEIDLPGGEICFDKRWGVEADPVPVQNLHQPGWQHRLEVSRGGGQIRERSLEEGVVGVGEISGHESTGNLFSASLRARICPGGARGS